MKIRDLAQSESEIKAYNTLNRALSIKGYKIWKSVRVCDVLLSENSELNSFENDLFRKMHFENMSRP